MKYTGLGPFRTKTRLDYPGFGEPKDTKTVKGKGKASTKKVSEAFRKRTFSLSGDFAQPKMVCSKNKSPVDFAKNSACYLRQNCCFLVFC